MCDLYLRKSTDDNGRSVDRQRAELTEAAVAERLTIGRVFVDPDFSASRYRRRERPDYAALLEHISAGRCQVLGLYEVSRGSRDLTEWSALLDLCRQRGTRIWIRTHDRVYDLARRRDWRVLADDGLDAADESERIAERVRSGKRKGAREGRPQGRLAYGFIRVYDDRGRYVAQVAHPDQAPIVAEMVRRVAAGEPLYRIASGLNADGVTMPGGSPWTGNHIRQMVMRPAIAGRQIHRGEDVGPAGWDAIVDTDQWATARALLTSRQMVSHGTELRHWLASAARCGRCGVTLQSCRTAGDYRYGCVRMRSGRERGCGRVYIAAAPLEACVEGLILGRLAAPDARNVFAAPYVAGEDPTAEIVGTLRGRLEAHYAEAAAGRLSARGLSVVEGQILAEIARVEAGVRDTRPPVPPLVAGADPHQLLASWPSMPPAARRDVVLTLAELVVAPALRRGRLFDPRRLRESQWVGDPRTWGEHWEAGGINPV